MDRNPYATACKIADEALRRLCSELRAGRSQTLGACLTAMSRFRHQPWSNALLIAAQRSAATRVATHHGWHDLDRMVRPGEKGILVFSGSARAMEYPFPAAHSRASYVYDVSQTEGQPVPEVRGLKTMADSTTPGLVRERARERLQRSPGAGALSLDEIDIRTLGVAFVVNRGLNTEGDVDAVARHMASNADNARAMADALAAIQKTSAEMLNELAPERPALPGINSEHFQEIHDVYRDRMVQSITGMVRDREAAEDITARAFQKAWEKREAFRNESSISTWIEAIARNEARSAWRTSEWSVQFEPIDRAGTNEPVAPERVIDELEKREDKDRLQKALAQLPAKQRRALMDHFIDGLSIRDIARREQVPFGTVLSRIHKGKELLREAWKTLYAAASSESASRTRREYHGGTPDPATSNEQRRDLPDAIGTR